MRWLWKLAAALLLVVSAAGFLGRFGEPFELLSNFRVQFLILAGLLIAPAAVTRNRTVIAMVLLALGCNVLGITPAILNTAPQAPAGVARHGSSGPTFTANRMRSIAWPPGCAHIRPMSWR